MKSKHETVCESWRKCEMDATYSTVTYPRVLQFFLGLSFGFAGTSLFQLEREDGNGTGAFHQLLLETGLLGRYFSRWKAERQINIEGDDAL
jgi:hypothetical protein